MENKSMHFSRQSDMGLFVNRVARSLQLIYKTDFSEGLVNRVVRMANSRYAEKPGWSEKDIILITYGNNVFLPGEKPLQTLHRFLKDRLADVISCVHILPFFPYTSDDGFSVADYLSVNPDLGSWDDIAAISSEFWLMCDLVINHVSSDHAWFRNYLTEKSPGKDYFIEACTTDDYRNVIRPRNSPLFTDFQTTRGPRAVWTTFSADQVDLNFRNPAVLLEMIRVLLFYLSKGIRIIRLDAIAFLWKTTGTSCLHQPETHEIVKLLRTIVSFVSPGTIILTETNVPNRENWSYFGNGDEAHMVYQFSLPPLLLYTLYSGNTRYLNQWAREVPSLQQGQTFLNYTASHDGIGIRPLEGLLPQEEISNLMESMTGFGGMVSNRTGPDGSQSSYEMNITYLDALKGTVQGIDNLQEIRFICSQTIMMEMQGIPAFYLNSVLGTSNDYQGVNATGRARSINRRLWCENELLEQLSSNSRHRYLYHELTRLMNIRAKCSLFHPECQQEVLDYDKGVFALVRCNKATGEKMYCVSNVTLQLVEFTIKTEEKKKKYDLIACEMSESSDRIRLNAYQTRWLVDKEIKG